MFPKRYLEIIPSYLVPLKKKKKEKKKKERERVRKKNESKNKMTRVLIMRDFQQLKFSTSSSKLNRGINLLYGAKVELDSHHFSSTPSFSTYIFIHHHFHYISAQPVFRITHMHILI
jgi:hypothetical protein